MRASPTTVIRFGDAGRLRHPLNLPVAAGSRRSRARSVGSARSCAPRGAVALEAGEDALGGDPADALRVLGDDGDARLEEVGQRHVVEADERGVAVPAELAEARG